MGLNNVRGGSLVELRHFDDEKIMSPVPNDEPLMGGDRLVYAGQIEELLELKKTHGLVSAEHHVFHYSEAEGGEHRLRTAHVRFGSHLSGITMRESHFESIHNVTLVAVSRRGKRIESSPRDVVLEAGDTLLLEMGSSRTKVQEFSDDLQFFDSSEIPNIGTGTFVSTAIMIAMVVVSALGIMPLLQCAFIAAAAMIVCRCCNAEQAMRAINWDILMVFAGSVVLGIAIQKTGIAERMAFGILDRGHDGHLLCRHLHHGVHLQHGSGCNVLPHHVSSC